MTGISVGAALAAIEAKAAPTESVRMLSGHFLARKEYFEPT